MESGAGGAVDFAPEFNGTRDKHRFANLPAAYIDFGISSDATVLAALTRGERRKTGKP
jgi:hypothetical protein